jgi:hypothetical protein
VLGGMIGLGGAEFRLPLRISLFGFAALAAVILNKAMSLIVVLTALPARLAAVPLAEHWTVVALGGPGRGTTGLRACRGSGLVRGR